MHKGNYALGATLWPARSMARYFLGMVIRLPFLKLICVWVTCASLFSCGPIDFNNSSKNRNSENEETSKPVWLVPDGRINTCRNDVCLGLTDGTLVNIEEGGPARLSVDSLEFDASLNWGFAQGYLLKIADQVVISGEINAIGTLWFGDFTTAVTLLQENREFAYREPTAPTVTGTWLVYTDDNLEPGKIRFVQLDKLLLLLGGGLCDAVPGRIFEDGSFYFTDLHPECSDSETYSRSYSGSFSMSRKSGTLFSRSFDPNEMELRPPVRLVKQE